MFGRWGIPFKQKSKICKIHLWEISKPWSLHKYILVQQQISSNRQNTFQSLSTVSSATVLFFPPHVPTQGYDCWWLIGFRILCEIHWMWRNRRRRALLSVIVNLSLCWCAGAGAALAGVLRTGYSPAPVDPRTCWDLWGEAIAHQLRGDRGEIICWFHVFKIETCASTCKVNLFLPS